ncbi:MAG: hypothetical protein B7C24_05090 [Bacteroidetes bacterium 4572_77]|nr:MAG: hypothetical protein B7C24_05090 [Bacteroidetes bacterium 4572_77]
MVLFINRKRLCSYGINEIISRKTQTKNTRILNKYIRIIGFSLFYTSLSINYFLCFLLKIEMVFLKQMDFYQKK